MGDKFTVGMTQFGLPYKITSTATAVEDNHVVEWQHPLGHRWRWELAEVSPTPKVFSDTWQLVINTGTTVVTFLMVFLIQNTQVRDTEAMQIKLDELIRVTEAASNALLDLEELDEATLDRYRETYEILARESRSNRPTDR